MSLDIRTHIDEPAKSKLAIGLWQGDECVGRSEMDVDGLDRLIVHLAQQREKLAKKVPMTLEGGERIRGQREPEWMCVFAQETDDQVLALRHAGFGWLGFQLSVKTARAMATALLNGSSRRLNEIIERRGLQ
jgi:glycine/D-amino acid oxidase-like deaminating enzyme